MTIYFARTQYQSSSSNLTKPAIHLNILSKHLLTVMVAVIYGGGLQLVGSHSQTVLYGLYSFILLIIVINLVTNYRSYSNVLDVLPYYLWFNFYITWGSIVSPEPQWILGDAIRVWFKVSFGFLVLGSVLNKRVDLERLINILAIAIIVNFLASTQQVYNPLIVIRGFYEFAQSSQSVMEVRPSGLWGNSNAAAFAFLIFFIISQFKKSTPLLQIAQVSSIVGIYLSASRSGMYLLLLFGLLLSFEYIKKIQISYKTLSTYSWILVLVIIIYIYVYNSPVMQQINNFIYTQNFTIHRLLDYREETTTSIPRTQIAAISLRNALTEPWRGHGLFTFHGGDETKVSVSSIGSHNAYIMLLGEIGIFGLLLYLLILFHVMTLHKLRSIIANERLIFIALFGCIISLGFLSHNLITSNTDSLYFGFLFILPKLLSIKSKQK